MRIILFCSLFFFCSAHAYVDLEENPQEFVLGLKQIHIPGHPHAFNPSIVRWRGGLLMSFREITESSSLSDIAVHSVGESIIGLIWLDEDFRPIGEVQILRVEESPAYCDDPRLLTVGDDLYIVYSDCIDAIPSEGGFRMRSVQLDFDGETFIVKDQERFPHFEGEVAERREKNWVPFDYDGHLLLAYSLSPHRILSPIPGTQSCTEVASSRGEICWSWGWLRGGTPGIVIDDHYLAIFHSCVDMASAHTNGEMALHYFMGAYTFSKEPPFEITQISPMPIVARGFYGGPIYEPYWKPVRVVFPCGLIADGPHLWVTYGRQDHEIWIAQIDKEQLLKSLVPIQSIKNPPTTES
jgi:predicted GH43/DUF377 family glycosyl hydrolase